MTIVKQKVELPRANYVKYSEAKPGQTLVVGKFLGTKMVTKYNTTTGETVPSHTFDADGEIIILNSAAGLDRLLATVEPGTLLDITFLGKESKVSKEGKKYKQNVFEVSVLSEN